MIAVVYRVEVFVREWNRLALTDRVIVLLMIDEL